MLKPLNNIEPDFKRPAQAHSLSVVVCVIPILQQLTIPTTHSVRIGRVIYQSKFSEWCTMTENIVKAAAATAAAVGFVSDMAKDICIDMSGGR